MALFTPDGKKIVEVDSHHVLDENDLVDVSSPRPSRLRSARRSRRAQSSRLARSGVSRITPASFKTSEFAKHMCLSSQLMKTGLSDVIVMDLDMPVMDGAEATRQIKSNPSLAGIKVLAVTGQNDSEKSRLIKDDCDDFIEKPFQVDELVETVKRLAIK